MRFFILSLSILTVFFVSAGRVRTGWFVGRGWVLFCVLFCVFVCMSDIYAAEVIHSREILCSFQADSFGYSEIEELKESKGSHKKSK